MAGDIFDLANLDDDELARLVREELADYATLDADSIVVKAKDGMVTLSGRLGTEEERRIAEHVLTDVIGVTEFSNEIFVDPIARDVEPDAVDDHIAAHANDTDEEPIGKSLDDQDPEAEHLEEDLDARLYGTHDVQSAIERGTAWEPPDSPTPEGN
ncbi:MAG: BON domain-containing protein [Gemmatimonadota bacterium]|nr:BON domain-containing protein [Gemmatimonadota bacterium]